MRAHRTGTTGVAVGAVAGLLLWTGTAGAAPLLGSSSGEFTDVTSCGAGDTCSGTSTNVLKWYKNSDGSGTEATLTAHPLSIAAANPNVPTLGITVAELIWNPGTTNVTPTFDYTVSLTFTLPDNHSEAQTFELNVANTAPGENLRGLALSDLTGLAFTFADGAKLSDFKYSVSGGTLVHEDAPNQTTDKWEVSDSSPVNDLFITADYTPVPEPTSLAVLGAALSGFGLAAIRRRRSARTAAG